MSVISIVVVQWQPIAMALIIITIVAIGNCASVVLGAYARNIGSTAIMGHGIVLLADDYSMSFQMF